MHEERRRSSRYAFSCNVESGPSRSSNQQVTPALRGRIVDLSETGAGLIGDRGLPEFTVAPFRFRVPDVPVPLPVLAQVRWVQPVGSDENSFRLGLTFLY
ncbi:MAG: PilZ domain-containing protein [Acidimicrobiia bacterium]